MKPLRSTIFAAWSFAFVTILAAGCGDASAPKPGTLVEAGAIDRQPEAAVEVAPPVDAGEDAGAESAPPLEAAAPPVPTLDANKDAAPDAGGTDGDAETAPDTINSPDAGPDAEAGPAPDALIDGPDGGPPDTTAGTAHNGGDRLRIISPHLQLWLRSDVGVDCIPAGGQNRVAEWRDQSPHERHARPPLGKPGPLCGPGAGSINGRDAITFPRTRSTSIDYMTRQQEEDIEYLRVDLSAIANTAFTLIIVERRIETAFASWMIGSTLPFADDFDCFPDLFDPQDNPNAGKGLMVGYPMHMTINATTWGLDCDVKYTGLIPGNKANITTLVYTPGSGMVVFVDGIQRASGPAPALTQIDGLIGRGFYGGLDSRYKGDMAEIVVFNVALTPAERAALEAQLHSHWDTTTSAGP